MKVVSLLIVTVVATIVHDGAAQRAPTTGEGPCEMACMEIYKPVCGSNGVTYENECRLRLANCGRPRDRETITILAEGDCESVNGVGTVGPAGGDPAKKCGQLACTMDYKPVCGSNGVTYTNKCELERAQCKSQPTETISLTSEGECAGADTTPGGPEPLPVPLPAPVSDAPQANCERACTRDYRPICGSDGHTYANSCELGNANCRRPSGVAITQVTEGECVQSEATEEPPTATPSAGPACTEVCPMDYSPVCGSDGTTYSNKCSFEQAKCKRRIANMTFTEGACAASDAVTPVEPAQPATPQPPQPQPTAATCKRICPKNYNPVCGSNGKTYANKCMFDNTKCKPRNASLTFTEGACGTTKRSLRG